MNAPRPVSVNNLSAAIRISWMLRVIIPVANICFEVMSDNGFRELINGCRADRSMARSIILPPVESGGGCSADQYLS